MLFKKHVLKNGDLIKYKRFLLLHQSPEADTFFFLLQVCGGKRCSRVWCRYISFARSLLTIGFPPSVECQCSENRKSHFSIIRRLDFSSWFCGCREFSRLRGSHFENNYLRKTCKCSPHYRYKYVFSLIVCNTKILGNNSSAC